MSTRVSGKRVARRVTRGSAFLRVGRAVVAVTLLAGQVLAPAPVRAAVTTSAATTSGTTLNLGDVLQSAFQGLAAMLGLNAVSDTSPARTHDISPSTPWTAFMGGVNVVAGNLAIQSTDLSLASIGLPTTVARAYNSAAAGRTGPFGVGWYWSYGVYVVPGSGSATVVREDGRSDIFSGAGQSFTAPAGIYDALSQEADGSYTLTRHDQVLYRFSAAGELTQIVDPNSNTLSLTRVSGNVTGIVDTAGRNWLIQTDGSGRIQSLRDPANRLVAYQYAVSDTFPDKQPDAHSNTDANADRSSRWSRGCRHKHRWQPGYPRPECPRGLPGRWRGARSDSTYRARRSNDATARADASLHGL
jgi:hypothetical protein